MTNYYTSATQTDRHGDSMSMTDPAQRPESVKTTADLPIFVSVGGGLDVPILTKKRCINILHKVLREGEKQFNNTLVLLCIGKQTRNH